MNKMAAAAIVPEEPSIDAEEGAVEAIERSRDGTASSNVIERMFWHLKNGDASQPDMIATPKTTSQ